MAQYADSEIQPLPKKETHHSLGFVAGRTIGLGLSYRYNIQKWAFQVAFLPLKNKEKELYYTGFSVTRTIVEGNNIALFAIQSNMYVVENVFPVKGPNGNSYSEGSRTNQWNHGLGIGISADMASPITLYISAGYGAFKNFEEISFTIDAGIFYHF
jgi:hypothetical protein